ncbi:hypothetical protein Tco_0581360, partial [Tanacetum coccineum]
MDDPNITMKEYIRLKEEKARKPGKVFNWETDKYGKIWYDEEEQNILYFNDLFPFNIIHPDDLNLEKDNDDNDINIIQSSEGNEITHGSNLLSETSHDKITKTFRTSKTAADNTRAHACT